MPPRSRTNFKFTENSCEPLGYQMFNPAKHFAPSQNAPAKVGLRVHLLVESMDRQFTFPHLTELTNGRTSISGIWEAFTIGDEYSGGFEDIWTPPKDSSGDELIDVAALPKLPKLSKAKPETLEVKVEPPPPPTAPPPIPQQPDAIHFMYVPPDAQRFLNGGK